MPYVNQRWIGGFLTNFRTIRTRIKKYKELLALREQGYIESLDYKEQKRVMRELEKLDKYYSGVKDMDTCRIFFCSRYQEGRGCHKGS